MENDKELRLKKYTPVVIFISVVAIIDILIVITASSQKPNSATNSTEEYDNTAGTIIDTYQGATSTFISIRALNLVESTMPYNAYRDFSHLLPQYTTLAFPDDQFSYKKDTLAEDPEDGYYTFQIASKNRTLTIRYSVVGEDLAGFTVTNANGAELYAYTAALNNATPADINSATNSPDTPSSTPAE